MKTEQFLFTVKGSLYSQLIEELDHKAKEELPAVMRRLSCQMFFEWLRNCVQETIAPGTSCFDQAGNEAKTYQETEFLSSEGHLFNFFWLLSDFSFFTGCCTG